MKLKNPMLVVTDMNKSVEFYQKVFGLHVIMEHPWGQRVVRFYDPDKHIIEVGENMKTVCKQFLDSGMTPEQAARRMDVPVKFVNACMR